MSDPRAELIRRWTGTLANKQAICLGCDATLPTAEGWNKASLLIRRQRANVEVEFWQRALRLVKSGSLTAALKAAGTLRDYHSRRASQCEEESEGCGLMHWSEQTTACLHRQHRDLWQKVVDEIGEAQKVGEEATG